MSVTTQRAMRGALALTAVSSAALLVRMATFLVTLDVVPVRPWLTALAAAASIVGAVLVLRGRTWGLWLTTSTAISFGGVAVFGIAPPWFAALTVIGLGPVLLAAPSLLRWDRAATIVFIAVGLAVGVAASIVAGPGVDLGAP